MLDLRLSDLKEGAFCLVSSLDLQTDLKYRLQELGLLPGSVVECAYIAPGGSPIAVWVKGALIALRLSDCKDIRVVAYHG